jgi:cell division protein FtsX
MDNFITANEAASRPGIFFGVFVLLALAVIATIAFASRILLRKRRNRI